MSKYIAPTANNYPGLDRGFNQRFKLDGDLTEANGEGVYLVTDAQDIVDTLENIHGNYSPQSGEIKVIAGGHCYENFVFQSSADTDTHIRTRFVIDVSNMRGISEETLNGTDYIVVEPGASNWLIQQSLHSLYGAALPGGSCYSVCAGGHIAGGGYGLLSRLHGLTVDYLAGVEMVIPAFPDEGYKIRRFNPESDADQLDWASRGGGAGHFGVVTKYYFEKSRVPLAPERALFIALPVPWKQFVDNENGANSFVEFLQAYYNACKALPEQAFTLGKFTYMQHETDVMNIAIQVVYGNNSGHDSATLGGETISPLTEKADALAVIEKFAAALNRWIAAPETSSYRNQPCYLNGRTSPAAYVLDTVYDLPWIDMTQMLNGSGENQNGKYKSSCMISNFNDAEAKEIYAFLTDKQFDNPAPAAADKSQTLIQIDSYGAQINNMDDGTKTAVAARSSQLKLQYQTYWKTYEGTTPEEAKQIEQDIVSWFNTGYCFIHWQATGYVSYFPEWGDKYQGCYFNYPDKQLGVNEGYHTDPGTQRQDFLGIYFGETVRDKLLAIKKQIDPENRFAHAQSVLNPAATLQDKPH